MGTLLTISVSNPPNFYHFLLNNGIHESVGGGETGLGRREREGERKREGEGREGEEGKGEGERERGGVGEIMRGCGYGEVIECWEKEGVERAVGRLRERRERRGEGGGMGVGMVVVWLVVGTREGLGRPREGPKENKERVMEFLGKE